MNFNLLCEQHNAAINATPFITHTHICRMQHKHTHSRIWLRYQPKNYNVHSFDQNRVVIQLLGCVRSKSSKVKKKIIQKIFLFRCYLSASSQNIVQYPRQMKYFFLSLPQFSIPTSPRHIHII